MVSNNHMKANHIPQAYFGGALVELCSTEKSHGIQIDSDPTFDVHIFSLCNKAGKKIHVLSCFVNYMSFDTRRMVMKAFTESHFNYCPLIWMFHSRTLNNKSNCLHERALRIICSDYKSSFCELLEKGKSFSIDHKSIQSLSIEIFKFLHNLSPSVINNIFKTNQTVSYDVRKRNVLFEMSPKRSIFDTKNKKVEG